MINIYDLFRKYEVEAASVADYLARYYKPSRYTGRGTEYATAVLKSHEDELKRRGFCFISHHDSVTGEIVAYYGNAKKKAQKTDEQQLALWGAE